jgi:hypothetical protein
MLERKPISHFDNEVIMLMRLLRFKHNTIRINGSSTLRQLHYFADIDMFSQLKKQYDAQELLNGFKNILFKIKHNSKCYFLELKIQLKDGSKIKIFPNGEELELFHLKENLHQIDFVKIDIAYFLHFRFIEVSCIYQVGAVKTNIIQSLQEDISKYFKEKKYFKMLKRYFNLFNLTGKTEKAKTLLDFFNSKFGFYYVILSNLEVIELLQEYYNDFLTQERINLNLKMFKIPKNSLESEKQEIEKEVNKEAFRFFSENLK